MEWSEMGRFQWKRFMFSVVVDFMQLNVTMYRGILYGCMDVQGKLHQWSRIYIM